MQPHEALGPQPGMDAAAEVLLKVAAGFARVLVDGEVRGPGEGQCDAAQSEAVPAVGAQGGTVTAVIAVCPIGAGGAVVLGHVT